jgi:drug/metabolite transporter (DMT)-like permease
MGRATLDFDDRSASHVSVSVVLAVLGAGALHALWNALAKSLPDQFAGFALINLGTATLCLVAWPFVGLPRTAAWAYLGGSVVCHLGYETFLMGSYRRGDFSQSYPVARGSAPVFVTLGGLLVAGEHLGARGVGGVAAVVLGIAGLAVYRGPVGVTRGHVVWALATGAAIAVYSVVDGLGVRASHDTLRYAVTLFSIQATLWVAGAVARRGVTWWPAPKIVGLGVLAGVLSVAGYAVVLWAQRRAPLGEVSALRETGVLWAAVIGSVAFHERPLRRVVLPAVAVVAGVVLLSGG